MEWQPRDEERELGEAGFRQAIDRLRRAIDSGSDTLLQALIPLGEALGWAFSLEEWHRKRLELEGRDYYKERAKTDAGRTTAAVTWARSFIAHDLTHVGVLVRILGFPGTLPFTLPGPSRMECRWVTRIPHASKDKHGRDKLYEHQVADRNLVSVLREVEKFFLELP